MKIVSCYDCNKSFDIHKTKSCPECGVAYKDREVKPFAYALGYPQCEWESNGQRCRYPGSISSNIGGGPWYCRMHFECGSGTFGAQVVDASRDYRHATKAELIAEVTAAAKKAVGDRRAKHIPVMRGRLAGLDWAKKVMARIDAGEEVPLIVVRMAKEALGIKDEVPSREAGATSTKDPALQVSVG